MPDREKTRLAVRAEALVQQDGRRAPTHERVWLRADCAAQASTARADVRLDKVPGVNIYAVRHAPPIGIVQPLVHKDLPADTEG